MLVSLDFTTLVANTVESQSGSDGSPYEKRVDARGRVTSDKCIANEVPFEELPDGWAWARLEDCCNAIVDCPHSTPSYLAVETGYSAIDTNCMDDNWHLTGLRSLSRESYEKRTKRYVPQAGDIIFGSVRPGLTYMCPHGAISLTP